MKNNCTVLVVEDDHDIRESIKEFLEIEDFKVVTAVNGKDALEILATLEKPCLVLLDMMMPIMNGREFLDVVSKNAVLAPIPVVIFSAIANKENTSGSVGYIKKPADLDAILKIVKNFCVVD